MRSFAVLFFILINATAVFTQGEFQRMFDNALLFDRTVESKGQRAAFLEFLSDDAVIFRPNALNGKDFWKAQAGPYPALSRKSVSGDISGNGLIGYTFGSQVSVPDPAYPEAKEFGQFLTIWEKKADGKFRISLNIEISHDEPTQEFSIQQVRTSLNADLNIRGWSATNDSMSFFRTSMHQKGLSDAYEKFAALDVKLLRDGQIPAIGKEAVLERTKPYTSITFPSKLSIYHAADMAYVWNPCDYSNSNEGIEKGNCLHIWKLRKEKWWIVFGVFAKIKASNTPQLVLKPKKPKNRGNKN